MNEELTVQSEQPEPLPEQNEAPTVFLGIGVVINLILITAYFVWAYKQWKKSDRRDE